MTVSGMRSSLIAGPILIAATTSMAGAVQAAPCADLVKAFDEAVAGRAMDAAVRGLESIGEHPLCVARIDEFRAKLVDFLIDYAHTEGLADTERDKAIGKAEKTVYLTSYWQGKAKLGDYYFAHRV
jgi:hypothetical protein